MQVAIPSGRTAVSAATDAVRERAGTGLPPRERAEFVETARQGYLDALPIAGATIRVNDCGGAYVELANERFRAVTGWRDNETGRWIDEIAFLRSAGIAQALTRFFADGETMITFEANDGQNIGGRHFTIGIGRLRPTAFAGDRCLLTIQDRTGQIESERSLRAEMLRDSLTGLPNRLAFNERVEAILEAAEFTPGSHAVLVIDMMRFSRVNECVGAIAGDELLVAFARRLISALRAGDILARTGGDEFGILMRLDKGVDDAIQVAERIKTVLATPFRLSELEIRVDCAIGCALVTEGIELADEVLRNAQFALKHAKRSGAIQFYEANQAEAAHRRFSIETELRRAIEDDALTLAFQPLIDLPTGNVSGFEALARWEHPTEGTIAPDEFIPVAEESGLILALGRWALAAATQALADWDRTAGRTLPLYVAVNVSAIQIARDDVAAVVADALAASGLAGNRLTIELTESAIVRDPERATEVLAALKALDVRVAMDDFGTGYTSLAYLQRLPIDVLKIDRSFVSGMLGDRDSVAIIRAVLSLADALGMATTAEGIESEELARALTELGCTHGQGFFFARPLGPDQALAYWLSRNA